MISESSEIYDIKFFFYGGIVGSGKFILKKYVFF